MTDTSETLSPSELIDARLAGYGDWRGEQLAYLRGLIKKALPGVEEQVKWRKPTNNMLGVPVWYDGGMICTGEAYKGKIKLTFAKGGALPDPAGLFNAGQGGVRRAIDMAEDDTIDEAAFCTLVQAAATLNHAKMMA